MSISYNINISSMVHFDDVFGCIDLFELLADNLCNFKNIATNKSQQRLYAASKLSTMSKLYLHMSKILLNNIRYLNFNNITRGESISFKTENIPLKYCANLTYLCCKMFDNFDFLKSISYINVLNLSKSCFMNDVILDTISDNCQELSALYIDHCLTYRGLTIQSIERLLIRCKKLKIINLSGMTPQINNINPELFRNLSQLYMGFNYLEQDNLINILDNNNNIEIIDFNYEFNKKSMKYFKLPIWSGSKININIFNSFKNCNNLTDISLTGQFDINDAINILCTNNKNIKSLRLNVNKRCDINKPIETISNNLKDLVVLEFMYNFDKRWYCVNLSIILKFVIKCVKLTKLGIKYTVNMLSSEDAEKIQDILYSRNTDEKYYDNS